jgi:hypothetical protein
MKLEFEGNSLFLKKIKNLPREVQEEVEDELQVAIDSIYNEALKLAPTDLAGGVGIRGSGYKDVRGLEGEVGFTNKYAAYQEFGTGSRVNIPLGLEKYAMTFFVNGEGRLPATPFLFPAFFREGREFEKRLGNILEETWGK